MRRAEQTQREVYFGSLAQAPRGRKSKLTESNPIIGVAGNEPSDRPLINPDFSRCLDERRERCSERSLDVRR